MIDTADKTLVYLGNRDAVEVVTDRETGQQTRIPAPGKRCTSIAVPSDLPLMEAAHDITHKQGVWAAHSDGTPAWVASTNAALAQLLASHWKCELRQPDPEPGDRKSVV